MTTTPATTDLDTLKALLDAMPEGPWRVALSQPNPGIRTAGGWEVLWATYADTGPQVLEFIAAARNALPALLDELANARTLIEGYAELLKGQEDRAERNLASSVQASNERDAARAELAKTRAELEQAKRDRDLSYQAYEDEEKEHDDTAERALLADALLLDAKSVILKATRAHCSDDPWRTEASRWVQQYAAFTGDEDAEDAPCKTCGKPWRNRQHECEASPATTAESAAEPKATIRTALGNDWSNLLNDDEPECGHDRAKADDTECPECGADLAALDAEPADEPKATVDLADPNACRHCGINEQDHANRWTETVGWHTWVDPGNEVRKTRMLLRRQAKAEPAAS